METKQTNKQKYQELKTLGDSLNFVKNLEGKELNKLRDALQIVNDNLGLDMKRKFTLNLMNSEVQR